MIDILMTTYYRLDFTKKVIEAIISRTDPFFRLIVVDNGSQDGTREYLQEMEKKYPAYFKRVILLPENVGLQKAKNIGMEYVTTELFVNTDNDCIPPKLAPCWLKQQIELMERNPQFAAISLRPQTLVGVGPIFRDAKEVVENNVAGGSLRLMRTAAVKEVGGWLDDFENRQEEWNICTKLRKAGYKVGYAKELFCYHMFGPGNWGYPKDVKHYHNQSTEIYARDEIVDLETNEPRIRKNE